MDSDSRGSATAPVARRVLAWVVDYLIVMVPGLVLVLLATVSLLHGLPGYVGTVAAEAGWGYLLGMFTGATSGATASGAWITFVLPLIVAVLFVPLLQFGYQLALLSWRGRTVGKAVLDTRVSLSGSDTPRGGLARGAAMRRAFLTTTLETGLVAIALILIIIGHFILGLMLWAAAIAAFWLNAFTVFGPGRRTLIDRLSGTSVLCRGLYAEAAGRTAALAHRTAAAVTRTASSLTAPALPATPTTPEIAAPTSPVPDAAAPTALSNAAAPTAPGAVTAARAAGRATADAAAVAGQLAREGAETIVRSAPVQQALNSRAGQQAQALGAAGAEKARELRGQAAERARKLGGRAQELWRQRKDRTAAAPPADPTDPADPVGPAIPPDGSATDLGSGGSSSEQAG